MKGDYTNLRSTADLDLRSTCSTAGARCPGLRPGSGLPGAAGPACRAGARRPADAGRLARSRRGVHAADPAAGPAAQLPRMPTSRAVPPAAAAAGADPLCVPA